MLLTNKELGKIGSDLSGGRISGMDDTKRLELIAESVKYCQRVKRMGMPSSCYTKALREPVHFLWERRKGSKVCAAKFRSKAAKRLSVGKGQLIYDHAIPFRYLQEELLSLPHADTRSIRILLNKFCIAVLITKKENRILSSHGYRDRMPENGFRFDPRARYKAVGIKVVKNKCNSN